jgi:hypothetical protein
MAKLGFKVKELFGGIECWKADGYSTDGTQHTKGIDIKRSATPSETTV